MTYVKARKHTTDQRLAEDNDTSEYALPNGMDKYQILETLRRIAPQIGLSDGAIAQYKIYLDYTQDMDWQSGNSCMVWVSVQKIANILMRTTRQVRNNAQKLIDAGIIAYDLCGNHRRGGVRNSDGTIKWASGIDLKPVLERWHEFSELEARLRAELEESNILRKNISRLRRKIIDSVPDDLEEDAYAILNQRPKASSSIPDLEHIFDRLNNLNAEIINWHREQVANDVDENDILPPFSI